MIAANLVWSGQWSAPPVLMTLSGWFHPQFYYCGKAVDRATSSVKVTTKGCTWSGVSWPCLSHLCSAVDSVTAGAVRSGPLWGSVGPWWSYQITVRVLQITRFDQVIESSFLKDTCHIKHWFFWSEHIQGYHVLQKGVRYSWHCWITWTFRCFIMWIHCCNYFTSKCSSAW